MTKKLNKYINYSMILSAMLVVLGIVIFIYPSMSLKIFSYSVSVIMILFGIYLILEDFRNIWLLIDFSILGIIMILLGIILFKYPNTLATLIPVFLGIWIIASSIVKFRLTSIMVNYSKIWVLTFIMSILSIVCGVLFIVNPISSAEVITSFAGILIFAYAITDIIDMIVFKININRIIKNIEKA